MLLIILWIVFFLYLCRKFLFNLKNEIMANLNFENGEKPSFVYGIFIVGKNSSSVIDDWGFFYNESIAEATLSRLRDKYPDFDFVLKGFVVFDYYK